MVDSNLAVLLAERNLKITKVSRDTGISRTTLTALCYDQTAGIKYDTLNTLCKYLQITPTEFFSYTEYDYEIKYLGKTELEENSLDKVEEKIYAYDVDIIVKKSNMTWRYPIIVVIPISKVELPFVDLRAGTLAYYTEVSDDATPMDIQAVREYQRMEKEMTQRQFISMKNQILALVKPVFIADFAKDYGCSKDQVLASDDSMTILTTLKVVAHPIHKR
ncbi:MAG: helix-turn-helix transcriptional regulator [Eubacterium sp.]|nr:helix-turn-helix transcriptional regulator [Eubacterium sp.]